MRLRVCGFVLACAARPIAWRTACGLTVCHESKPTTGLALVRGNKAYSAPLRPTRLWG
jgi:hypothetical protein